MRVEMAGGMGGREWGMLLLLSVLWGASFFFIGLAVRELPALTIVLARLGIAALALLAVLRATGLRLPRGRAVWGAFLVSGLLNCAFPFLCFTWGQQHIPSGLASVLNATTPLFTVIVAHGLTPDEKLTPGKLAGVLIGIAGVAVMLGADLRAGFERGLAQGLLAQGLLAQGLLAQGACLLAALSYAFAGVYGRRFRRMGVPPLATAAGQVSMAAAIMLPLTLLVDRPWVLPIPGAPTWAALLGIGLLSTALAYVLYFRILAVAGATNLVLVTFLVPVSAILLGVLVLGEDLAPRQILGMALIGLALAVMDGRLPRVLRRCLRAAQAALRPRP